MKGEKDKYVYLMTMSWKNGNDGARKASSENVREKDTFNDKQSQIAERKTGGE